MKKIALMVSLTLVEMAVGLMGCSPKPALTGDVALLQGKWQGLEIGGRTTEPLQLETSGNSMTFRSANGREWYRATFALQEDKQPKEFVGMVTACVDPKLVGKEIHAIYRLEANTFTLKGNGPGQPSAPASFDAPDGRCFELKKK